MTREEFQKFCEKGPVLLDGATGSWLTKMGMPKGVCTETWAMEHPDVILDLQKAYIAAGSQIIYAPTFSLNPISLKNFGLEQDYMELNRRGVALARQAAEGSGALVAGDMSTTGRMLEPAGVLTYDELYQAYAAQIRALDAAGVDLIIAETMMSVDEMTVFLDAGMNTCDLPLLCSMTVQADGTGYFGGNVIDAVETLQEMGASAVGLNCSLGPDQLESIVSSMKRVARIPVIVKPNAGLPTITPTGEAIYSMGPEEFARHMKVLYEAGADLIGGCCGTTPDYIRQLRDIL